MYYHRNLLAKFFFPQTIYFLFECSPSWTIGDGKRRTADLSGLSLRRHLTRTTTIDIADTRLRTRPPPCFIFAVVCSIEETNQPRKNRLQTSIHPATIISFKMDHPTQMTHPLLASGSCLMSQRNPSSTLLLISNLRPSWPSDEYAKSCLNT